MLSRQTERNFGQDRLALTLVFDLSMDSLKKVLIRAVNLSFLTTSQ